MTVTYTSQGQRGVGVNTDWTVPVTEFTSIRLPICYHRVTSKVNVEILQFVEIFTNKKWTYRRDSISSIASNSQVYKTDKNLNPTKELKVLKKYIRPILRNSLFTKRLKGGSDTEKWEYYHYKLPFLEYKSIC